MTCRSDKATHIGTQQLWSYFAPYLDLPRLRDRTVLARAIADGVVKLSWSQDTFAAALRIAVTDARFEMREPVGRELGDRERRSR